MPAQSQQQQKLFGLALAFKRGEVPASEVSDEIKDIADRMSEKEIEDFASTKHKGLPKMKEQLRKIVREIMRERAISEMNEAENPCWKGYEQIGMKMKDGKEVPNCVPKNESVNEGNVKLPSSAKKFWNTPAEKLIKTYGSDLKNSIPPSQWNTHPEIIDGYGQNAGVDIFKGFIRDNLDSNDRLDPKLAKMIGIPTNVSIIDYLNDGGSGLNGNKYFKKYDNWFSALYDIYEEMEKKFGKMKPQSVGESVNEARIKGRNNKTGESFGMVIGSDKKNREGDFEVTIRKGYSSRISAYGFVFDKDSNLISIKDYGYSMDGKFPDMKGSSSVSSVRPNKRETITQIAKITSPAFAKKIYQHVQKNNKMDESVNEGASTEEKRIVMMAVKKIAKYRNVPLDYAVGDVMRAAQELERDIKKGKIK